MIGSYSAGEYLVRYDPDNIGVQTENVTSPYLAYINLPTPYGLSLTRILVESSADDVETVRSLQDQLSITLVPRNGTAVAPALDLAIFEDAEYMPGAENTLEEGVLKLTAKLASFNGPEVKEDRVWVPQVLQQAGMHNGNFSQRAGVNLTAASATANATATALLATSGFQLDLGGNWTIKNDSVIGDYGSYYPARYQVATGGYLALTSEQVIYPSYGYGKSSTITTSQSILLTFSAKPTVQSSGFWSLTVYDGDGFLIPNQLDRYALGDRSNLTFSDGTLLSDRDDGVFQILIQANNTVPPSNWTNNWLPGPLDGGAVSLNLRLYGAEEDMKNGSYTYPVVNIVDAIVD